MVLQSQILSMFLTKYEVVTDQKTIVLFILFVTGIFVTANISLPITNLR